MHKDPVFPARVEVADDRHTIEGVPTGSVADRGSLLLSSHSPSTAEGKIFQMKDAFKGLNGREFGAERRFSSRSAGGWGPFTTSCLTSKASPIYLLHLLFRNRGAGRRRHFPRNDGGEPFQSSILFVTAKRCGIGTSGSRGRQTPPSMSEEGNRQRAWLCA